jgi:hypothetical protein
VREFIQHADFGEREFALVEAFFEDSNLAGIEAVEAAYGVGGLVEGGGHPEASVRQLSFQAS